MIKKWILAAVAYLLIVIIGYNLYTSVIRDTISHNQQNVNHEMRNK